MAIKIPDGESGDRRVFDDVAVQAPRFVGDGLVFAFWQDAGHRAWGGLAMKETLREGCVFGPAGCAHGVKLYAADARIQEQRPTDVERLTEEVCIEARQEDGAAGLCSRNEELQVPIDHEVVVVAVLGERKKLDFVDHADGLVRQSFKQCVECTSGACREQFTLACKTRE